MSENIHSSVAQAEPIEHLSPMQVFAQSNVVNFILVIIFLIWAIRKANVVGAIASKQKEIKDRIKNAEEDKVRSELELDATKKRLRKSDEEVERIIKDSENIAESLSKRIIKEAEISKEEAVKKAEKTIEAEKEMASTELTREISRAAFLIAEDHVKQAIDDRLHKKYIDDFIDNIPNLKV